ncbi:MAG: vWA domain-containing protein, partial [Gemmatimonadales bacterium]
MAHWVEGLFDFLFKYRPAEFAASRLTFGAPFSVIVLLLAAAAIGVPAVLSYAAVRGRSSRRDRWVLGALRVSALVVLMACLFRPMLLLSAAVPQRNYVGVLIDDSRSMRIADQNGKPRSDWVEHAFGGPDSSVLKALRAKFIVRLFRFSSSTQRIDSAADLSFAAGETHVGSAVEQARQELDGVPLSGLVLLTDGADNSRAPISDELLSLRARSVPIYAVGLGADRFSRDIEIRRVEASHSVLKGSSLVADLLIRQRGFGGRRVPLIVEDAGRIVSRDSITLPPDGDAAPVRVTIAATEAGPRSFTFRIPLQPGEEVAENNEQQALVYVRNGRAKILYVEGVPRYEMRFIRAAVEADSNLQLIVLQRTADNKFLRLNVDSASDLAGGFPKTRAELFRNRAVIVCMVEASFISHDNLAMLS